MIGWLAARSRVLILLLVVAAAVLLLALRGCAAQDANQNAANEPTTGVQQPYAGRTSITGRAQPPATEAVQAGMTAMRKALTTIYTWEPAVEATKGEAFARATPWLTPELARPDPATELPMRGPSLQWSDWAKNRTRIVAEVELFCQYCLPDKPDFIRRTALVHQYEQAPDGQRVKGDVIAVFLTAVLAEGGWRVASMKVRY